MFSALSETWGFLLIALLFGGSIFIHELGHFLAARLFKLKVLRFSIGFGPKICQWTGKDGCKYILSLLPLGGYVAIPQLVDMGKLEGAEDDDYKIAKSLPKASCLAKICVSASGALFNVILAFVLALIVNIVGVPENEVLQTTQIGGLENITDVYGAEFTSPAKIAGLKEGDKIVTIDGVKVKSFEDIIEFVAMGAKRTSEGKPLASVEVERNGKILKFDVLPILVKTNISTSDEVRMIGVQPASKMRVGEVIKNSPAQKAGLKTDDEVVGVNGEVAFSPSHVGVLLNKQGEQNAIVNVIRNGKKLDLNILPKRVILTKPLLKISNSDFEIKFIDIQKNNSSCVKVFYSSPNSELNVGDMLYEVNGKKVKSVADVKKVLASSKNCALAFIDSNFNLKNKNLSDFVVNDIPAKSKMMLGYSLKNNTIVVHPSILEQFSSSIQKVVNALTSLINPKSDIGISSLAGPVDIGRIIYKLSDSAIMLVISFTVLLNINLAVLNLLPIPVLDGGHIIFAIIEKLRGKAIPTQVFMAIQGIFTLLFLALMAYVVYIGFMRWNGDNQLEKQSEIYNQYYIKTKF